MKYYKQRFNPYKKNSIPEKEEISQTEFLQLCETKEAYFLSHEGKNEVIESHMVHVIDLLL